MSLSPNSLQPGVSNLSYVKKVGGAVRIAYDIYINENGKTVGIVIAGNSGLPGGGLGKYNEDGKTILGLNVNGLTKNQKPQEESIVKNWLTAKFTNDPKRINEFNKIKEKWGVKKLPVDILPGPNCKRMDNDDMINYTYANPKDYEQSFFVGNVDLKHDGTVFTSNLIFTAGPNLCKSKNDKGENIGISDLDPKSTMDITLNIGMRNEVLEGKYTNFVEGIKWALYSSFIKMIEKGIKIALVPKLSSNIYSKCIKNEDFQEKIKNLYADHKDNIVAQVMKMKFRDNQIMDYFDKIIIADIAKDNSDERNFPINKVNVQTAYKAELSDSKEKREPYKAESSDSDFDPEILAKPTKKELIAIGDEKIENINIFFDIHTNMVVQDEIFKYDKNKILKITENMHTNSNKINSFFHIHSSSPSSSYNDKKNTIEHKLQLIKDISDEIIKKKK